jgi:pyrimidine deaminase RibD-like protein
VGGGYDRQIGTYNDLLVNDVAALVVVQGDVVGQNTHHDHGRDPDEDVAEE